METETPHWPSLVEDFVQCYPGFELLLGETVTQEVHLASLVGHGTALFVPAMGDRISYGFGLGLMAALQHGSTYPSPGLTAVCFFQFGIGFES